MPDTEVGSTKDDVKMYNDDENSCLTYTLNAILDRLKKLEAK